MIIQENSQANILLVADQQIVAYSIKNLLNRVSGINEIDFSATGNDTIKKAQSGTHYDVIIIDVDLPDIPGFELLTQLRKIQPDAFAILHSMQEKFWHIRQLMRSGADGIALKSDELGEIKKAIEHALKKEKYYSAKYLLCCSKFEGQEELTTREIEVLKGIADGKTSSDIAEGLFVSQNTIEFHRKKLMKKLKACNMAELIKKAVDNGYL